MDIYPVDIDPEQVVRWLMVERERGASRFEISARRLNERHRIEPRADGPLGDAEREDLSDEATVARLDVSPTHASEGWRIVVSVEDELLPFDPEEDSEEEEEEPIDLDTFYLEFIRPGRGTASITAETEGPAGVAHLGQLLHAIETNSHVPESPSFTTGKIS